MEGGVLRLYGALLAEGGVVGDNYDDGVVDDEEENGDCDRNDEDDAACVRKLLVSVACLVAAEHKEQPDGI